MQRGKGLWEETGRLNGTSTLGEGGLGYGNFGLCQAFRGKIYLIDRGVDAQFWSPLLKEQIRKFSSGRSNHEYMCKVMERVIHFSRCVFHSFINYICHLKHEVGSKCQFPISSKRQIPIANVNECPSQMDVQAGIIKK